MRNKLVTAKAIEPLWSVHEAAEYLGVSPDLVYRRTNEGSMPCRKIGRLTKFLKSELEAWVASLPGAIRG